MFKFNFEIEQPNEPGIAGRNESDKKEEILKEEENEIPSIEEIGKLSYDELCELKKENNRGEMTFKRLYLNDEDSIEYLSHVDVSKDDKGSRLAKINKTHDVVSGEYEGGLKVWELSIDLAQLIYSQKSTDNEDIFGDFRFDSTEQNEFRVLELGCGHSLPSLSLLKLVENRLKSSSSFKIVLYLQDFNKEVIEELTFENVRKYLESSTKRCEQIDIKFVYGDWRRIGGLLPSDYFDVILTTETIYNKSNYKPLLDLFVQCLNRRSRSFVLLGAKTYYFGCSGHLEDFLKVAQFEPFRLHISPNLLALKTSQNEKNESKSESESESVVSSKEIIKIYI